MCVEGRSGPGLPDTVVGLVPVPAHVGAERTERSLGLAVDGAACPDEVHDRIDHFAVHIELPLSVGCVANPDWPGSAVSVESVEHALRRRSVPVHVVQHAQFGLRQPGRMQQPVDEGLCLPRAAERE